MLFEASPRLNSLSKARPWYRFSMFPKAKVRNLGLKAKTKVQEVQRLQSQDSVLKMHGVHGAPCEKTFINI